MSSDDNFFSRWSRRKALVREGAPVPAELPAADRPATSGVAAVVAPAGPVPAAAAVAELPLAQAAESAAAEPSPTMDDVERLTPESDYGRFVARGVDPGVKNAALKKLFTDPHFNVMDGLDIYIDDYGRPDPLPAGMLEQMFQSRALGLFPERDERERAEAEAAAAAAAAATRAQAAAGDAPAMAGAAPADPAESPAPLPLSIDEPAPDEDPDLRLQPHDDDRCARPEPGAGQDPGRPH